MKSTRYALYSLIGHSFFFFFLFHLLSDHKDVQFDSRAVHARIVLEKSGVSGQVSQNAINSSSPGTFERRAVVTPKETSVVSYFRDQRVPRVLSKKLLADNATTESSAEKLRCSVEPGLHGVKASMTPSAIISHFDVSPLTQTLEIVDGHPVLLQEYLLKTGKTYTFVFLDNSLGTYMQGSIRNAIYLLREDALNKRYTSGSLTLAELELGRLQTYKSLYGNSTQNDFLRAGVMRYHLALELQRGAINSESYNSSIARLHSSLNTNASPCVL